VKPPVQEQVARPQAKKGTGDFQGPRGWCEVCLTFAACICAQWGAASLSEVHTDAGDSLGVAKANKRRIIALEAQLKVRGRETERPNPTLEDCIKISARACGAP
jgi:hypothetical protein